MNEEKKKQLIRKLTSRKFWVALCGFITALLVAFNVDKGSIEQVTSIVMAFGSLMVYMLSESATDVASLKANQTSTNHSTYVDASESKEGEDGVRQE